MPKPAEEKQSFLKSRVNRWSARQVEALFKQVSSGGVQRPGWSLARLVSYALALAVHLCCVALVAAGIWVFVSRPNVVSGIVAILALLLAYELRPRLGSLRKRRFVRFRADAPALFDLLDQVAAEVGAKPAHAVIANGRWNSSYASVGWRRRRVVTIGLPLWDALSPDQKVAVLGHEFAHGVNGDARHGVVVGTSLASLARLYALVHPDPLERARRRGAGTQVGELVQALLREVLAAVFKTQQLISLRASQRAEYLADAIGARVASPASMAGALDVIMTGRDTYAFVIGERAKRRSYPARPDAGGPELWDELRSALAALPENERERRRRVNKHALPQVTETHPPSHLRISVLRGLPPSGASVSLTAEQELKIRGELAADYARIGK